MPEQSFDAFEMLWKVIVALIIIIGLFFVIIKFLAQKNKNNWLKTPVRSLGGTAFGPGKSLQIVEIGRTLYVVGVGDNIQLLDKIDDAEQIAHIKDSFQRKKHNETVVKTESEDQLSASFRELFQNKLKNISGRNQEIQKWIEEDNAKK